MDEKEFFNKLMKRGSKPYKMKHCLGSRDAFHWVRKNKWQAIGGNPCDKQLYSKIVSEVNKILADMLLEGHEIEFPHQLGHITLSCTPAKVYYKDGELHTNYWTDWQKTTRAMFEEESIRESHQRIKRVQPFIYKIKYYKRKARFHNRYFYCFRPNRSLVRAMGVAIERQRMNAEQIEE